MKLNRRKFCECGCGQRVKKRFVSGHYWKGKPSHNKGIAVSENQKRKQSLSMKGKPAWNKGLTKDTDKRIKSHTEEWKKNSSIRMAGENNPAKRSEVREKLKAPKSEGHKAKLRGIKKDTSKMGRYIRTDEIKNKMRGENNPAKRPEIRERLSKSAKLLWENMSEKEKNRRIRNSLTFNSPNKQEMNILSMLDSLYPNEWKFVGDGQVIINGKCPDFININGQKKIIELFGNHWHQGQNPKDRVKVFKPFGYKTLVIWESELKDINKVTRRIQSFHKQ